MLYSDEVFYIKLFDEQDRKDLTKFLDEKWKKGHIFSKPEGQKLFDWQYYNRYADKYNFFIARDSNTHEIIGVQGYIPTYLYDQELRKEPFVWNALVKNANENKYFGMGLLFSDLINNQENINFTWGVGLSEDSKKKVRAFQKLGFGAKLVRMNHHYICNMDIYNFKLLCGINDKVLKVPKLRIGRKIITIDKEQFMDINFLYDGMYIGLPVKSKKFYLNRYLEHPFYKYEIVGVRDENSSIMLGFFIIRIVEVEGARAIRIIDYCGSDDMLLGVFDSIQQLLVEKCAEYIDFYSYGLDVNLLEQAGFEPRNDSNDIIIPSYYEPFLQQNVDLYSEIWHVEGKRSFVFKGDSDQDRPNIL